MLDEYIVILTGIKENFSSEVAVDRLMEAKAMKLPTTEILDEDTIREFMSAFSDGMEFTQRGFNHKQVLEYCTLLDEAKISFEIYSRIV